MNILNAAKINAGNFIVTIAIAAILSGCAGDANNLPVTNLEVSIPGSVSKIDPMIYGQMLENVNDSMIYGGVVTKKGDEQGHVTEVLKELEIPVMRWPGGTVVHEYHWKEGIGPRDKRIVVDNLAWGGIENYQFGTDEFLQWCRKIGALPYINFNMGNNPKLMGSLKEAMEWVEYVNGSKDSPNGKLRAANGHPDPYNVLYWCLGNENYLTTDPGHKKESDTAYAEKLFLWASAIKKAYPDLQLLGIGQSRNWNETVLAKNGALIDFLTQHYYVNAKEKDGKFQDHYSTLFAPAKMEAHIVKLGKHLDSVNSRLNRTNRPIRLSVDEWNNRHAVYNGEEFKFTRQAPRRQLDAAVVASMLNVFIRQSPTVGMANYIFPVNAHGLVRTVADTGVFKTANFFVFEQYRKSMTGTKLNISVSGPGLSAAVAKPTISGDTWDVKMGDETLSYVDAAGVLNDDGSIYVSLVNRSIDSAQKVMLKLPEGYVATRTWSLSHKDINATNTNENRGEVAPDSREVKAEVVSKDGIMIDPCGVMIVRYSKL
jgi:alpha-L-arabinofuranosidase